MDVYKLTLNDAGDQYKYDGKWLPLISERVWLPVKFGPFTLPIPKMTYRAVQGPVIINKNGAFAVRYAGIDNVKLLEQYFRNTKAKDWAEWTKSMAIGGIPATNFIYADKTGRIAYIYNALFPDRKPGYDYTQVLPGDTSADVWAGPVGFDRYPKIVDPASGFVINANNTPYLAAGPGSEMDPKAYSPYLGIELGMTNRGLRSVELLSADTSITPEELMTIKFDTVYSRKSWVTAWFAKVAAANLKDAPDLAKAQALLATWDWSSDGKGAADALAEGVIRMGAAANWRHQPYPDVREALRTVVDHFMKTFGRIDPPLLEAQRLRRGTVDLPIEGGNDTLRATTMWDKKEPDGKGRVRHGDSFIMLVNWDKAGKVESQSIQPYGAATTRPNSPHFTDQMTLFTAHKFKPVHFEWADAVAHSKRRYRP